MQCKCSHPGDSCNWRWNEDDPLCSCSDLGLTNTNPYEYEEEDVECVICIRNTEDMNNEEGTCFHDYGTSCTQTSDCYDASADNPLMTSELQNLVAVTCDNNVCCSPLGGHCQTGKEGMCCGGDQ